MEGINTSATAATSVVLSPKFHDLWKRLCILERWLELAIRPSRQDCDPLELDLLDRDEEENEDDDALVDDCHELSRRIDSARERLNQNLPDLKGPYDDNTDDDLVPRPSRIPNSGFGLFYMPPCTFSARKSRPTPEIKEGSTICFYYGHIHNFHSARRLPDKSYLMLVQGDLLVDPRCMPQVKARYINDPLNESFVNCRFVSQTFWSRVVATRTIYPGEELFVAYGDAYWCQCGKTGSQMLLSR
jgi:hypothetical protein